jgi:HK97 family phage portal protein
MFNRLGRMFHKAAVKLSLLPTMAAMGALMAWDRFGSLVSQGYRRNAVAYACIRTLSTSVAEPPLKVYRKDDDEEVENHPLRALLERPNPHMSEFEFWELVVTHLSICGRAFYWKQRSNRGQPVALWPLRPDRVTPRHDPETLLAGWTYTLDGVDFPIPTEDILAFNLPDPGDETGGVIGGLGPLQVLAAEIDTDNEATGHVFSLLRNYAVPGVAVKVKGEVDEDEKEEFKREFVRRYGGSRRGEPAVIDGAEVEITPLSHTLRDLEFPDLRGVAESRICAVIGVPAILVGVKVGLDSATYSNVAGARRFWVQTRLSEWWRRLSDQIAHDLLVDFGSEGLTVRFDINGLPSMQEIMAERAERFAAAFKSGVILVDEYRQALGLDPLPGKAGQVLYRPISAIVTDPSAPIETPKPPALNPPPEDDPNDEDPPPREDDDEEAPPKSLRRTVKSAERIAAQVAHREAMAAPFGSDLAARWAKMGEAVVSRVKAKGAAPGETKAEYITAADEAEVGAVILSYSSAAGDAGWAAAADVLGEAVEDLPSEAVRQRTFNEIGRRIVGINANTRTDVARIVTLALDEGASLDELSKRLRTLFTETYKGRALTVARTESAHHYNQGSVHAYRESNVVEAVTVYDGDKDSACAAVNGSTQTLEWADANPVEHPNCQRVFAPVVTPVAQIAA